MKKPQAASWKWTRRQLAFGWMSPKLEPLMEIIVQGNCRISALRNRLTSAAVIVLFSPVLPLMMSLWSLWNLVVRIFTKKKKRPAKSSEPEGTGVGEAGSLGPCLCPRPAVQRCFHCFISTVRSLAFWFPKLTVASWAAVTALQNCLLLGERRQWCCPLPMEGEKEGRENRWKKGRKRNKERSSRRPSASPQFLCLLSSDEQRQTWGISVAQTQNSIWMGWDPGWALPALVFGTFLDARLLLQQTQWPTSHGCCTPASI